MTGIGTQDIAYREQACAICGQLVAALLYFYFLQGDVNLWPFPNVAVCTTIWHLFPTPLTIEHNKRQPLRFTLSFSTRLITILLGIIAPRSYPSSCALCIPLPAVYHVSLAESSANEFEIAASINCNNTVILGRRIWLVISFQMQGMKLTALEHHSATFHLLPFQRAVKFNSKKVIEDHWVCWVSKIQN